MRLNSGKTSGWACGCLSGERICLALVIAFGAAVRLAYLSEPMRHDEALTVMYYLRGGLGDCFNYSYPNNHVLHTLLAKGSTILFGIHPWSVRLPALLAGIATIPTSYFFARAFFGERCGLASAALFASYPYLIFYSTNARGYIIIVLLTMWLVMAACRFDRLPTTRLSLLMALIAAAGIFTVPTMLYPVCGVYLWLAYSSQGFFWDVGRLRLLAVSSASAVGLSAALYLPVILVTGNIRLLLDNRFVSMSSPGEFFAGLIPHLADIFRIYTQASALWAIVFFLAFAACGLALAVVRGKRDFTALLLSFTAAALFITLIKFRLPFPRTWIFFIPLLVAVADYAWSSLTGGAAGKAVAASLAVAMVGSSLAFATILREEEYFFAECLPESGMIAEYLKLRGVTRNDAVSSCFCPDMELDFALLNAGIGDVIRKTGPVPGTEYFVAKDEFCGIQSLTRKPVEKLLDFGNGAVYRVVR